MSVKTLHSVFLAESTKTQLQERCDFKGKEKILTTSKAKRGFGTTMALSFPLCHVKDAFWLLIWRESRNCLHYVHTVVGLGFLI